jgi:hypothetical protein
MNLMILMYLNFCLVMKLLLNQQYLLNLRYLSYLMNRYLSLSHEYQQYQ